MRVLLAVDGSEQSAFATEAVAALASVSHVTILHVVDLEQAKTQGYISDYQGVRISRTGKRFLVERATVWNIHQLDGTPLGQAATFSTWTLL